MPSSESDSQLSGSAAQGKKESKWHKRFVQQRLRGWSPILHARNAELYFLAVGVFCLALGIPILVASLNVVEYKARYDLAGVFADLDSNNQQELLWGAGDEGVLVMVEIEVTKRMTAPVRGRAGIAWSGEGGTLKMQREAIPAAMAQSH